MGREAQGQSLTQYLLCAVNNEINTYKDTRVLPFSVISLGGHSSAPSPQRYMVFSCLRPSHLLLQRLLLFGLDDIYSSFTLLV